MSNIIEQSIHPMFEEESRRADLAESELMEAKKRIEQLEGLEEFRDRSEYADKSFDLQFSPLVKYANKMKEKEMAVTIEGILDVLSEIKLKSWQTDWDFTSLLSELLGSVDHSIEYVTTTNTEFRIPSSLKGDMKDIINILSKYTE